MYRNLEAFNNLILKIIKTAMLLQLRLLIFATLFFIAHASKLAAEPNEATVIKGQLIDGGANCALIRTDDGEILAIPGLSYRQFPVGTKLEIEGLRIKRSTCQQSEMAFRIHKIVNSDNQPLSTEEN